MNLGEYESELVELDSPWNFETTVDKLTKAINSAGLLLITTLDHAAGAQALGLHLSPTTVLIYGHPRNGTAIMLVAPSAALDLPLRVLMREESPDRTVVAFHPIVTTLTRAGAPAMLARQLQPAQQIIREALLSITSV